MVASCRSGTLIKGVPYWAGVESETGGVGGTCGLELSLLQLMSNNDADNSSERKYNRLFIIY
jgi:hypothetical protein